MTTVQKDGTQIAAMFDRLAPRYNLMNRVMTMGQDQRWRRYLVNKAQIQPDQKVLDLASGTGDIALEIVKSQPKAKVTAGDFSQGMMDWGKQRPDGDKVTWVVCDAMNMPFEDASFDCVVFGYLLRNVEDIQVTLKEIKRVLKPGGRVVCLDTTPPPKGLMYPFLQGYLKFGLPLLGRLFAGNSGSYAYLSQSTIAFESPEALRTHFANAGYINIQYKTFMFNTIAIHWAHT
jgi:demethylmenaquinone methyltransferase/2-methoxy-6-polyprenyl-1,4-benzoquinol methylase